MWSGLSSFLSLPVVFLRTPDHRTTVKINLTPRRPHDVPYRIADVVVHAAWYVYSVYIYLTVQVRAAGGCFRKVLHKHTLPLRNAHPTKTRRGAIWLGNFQPRSTLHPLIAQGDGRPRDLTYISQHKRTSICVYIRIRRRRSRCHRSFWPDQSVCTRRLR